MLTVPLKWKSSPPCCHSDKTLFRQSGRFAARTHRTLVRCHLWVLFLNDTQKCPESGPTGHPTVLGPSSVAVAVSVVPPPEMYPDPTASAAELPAMVPGRTDTRKRPFRFVDPSFASLTEHNASYQLLSKFESFHPELTRQQAADRLLTLLESTRGLTQCLRFNCVCAVCYLKRHHATCLTMLRSWAKASFSERRTIDASGRITLKLSAAARTNLETRAGISLPSYFRTPAACEKFLHRVLLGAEERLVHQGQLTRGHALDILRSWQRVDPETFFIACVCPTTRTKPVGVPTKVLSHPLPGAFGVTPCQEVPLLMFPPTGAPSTQ